ncbi:MAG: alpha/beta fold hydrolase [Anaerolineales bacterium]
MSLDPELFRRPVRLPSAPPITVSVLERGAERPRRTMVFLHGFGGSARQWAYQLEKFSARDRVIALDLRGHGASSAPDGRYDMPALVGDVEHALKALSVRRPLILVGHSFGAAVAVEYALRHPRGVDRLILIAASGEYPLALPYRVALAIPLPILNTVYPWIRKGLGARPAVLRRIYRDALGPWKGWEKLTKIHVPTLVIRGHRDRVFGRQYMEEVSRRIAGCTDVNVGASGHMVMLERHEAVNRAIERFLDGTGDRRPAARRPEAGPYPWRVHYDSGVLPSVTVPPIRLDHFLEVSAARHPGRAALVFEDGAMSYRDLDREANRFGQALQHLGVLPGDRVMLLLPNLPQAVVCFYGTLRAGAVAVFATPLSEPEELLRQVRDSGAEVLVTLTRFHDAAQQAMHRAGLRHVVLTGVGDYLPWAKGLAFRIGRARREGDAPPNPVPSGFHMLRPLLASQPARAPDIQRDPESLSVLQYTGGTTDVPRGVMLSHRNLVANTLQVRQWIPDLREGEEVVLSVLPFSHIYGLTTAMSVPISLAGTMVILSNFVTPQVLRAIRRHRPTLFPGVPTMYTALNDDPGIRRYRIDSIRACISGAAPLPVEVQEAFERLTRGRLVEGYGLTEASPVTHANPLHGTRRPGSIGLPLPSTDAKIVDFTTGRDLRPGKVGELAVRGPQVMMGYWNRERETRAALRRGGWLLTGDLARMDPDGFFHILARKKEMILAGRYQVYPRDVEEILHEHPKVREAAVVGIARRRWPLQRVKAYVVLRQGESVTEQELIRLCRGRLKAYAVPWTVEFVSELPKSFVGKVLRRVLLESDADSPQADLEARA